MNGKIIFSQRYHTNNINFSIKSDDAEQVVFSACAQYLKPLAQEHRASIYIAFDANSADSSVLKWTFSIYKIDENLTKEIVRDGYIKVN